MPFKTRRASTLTLILTLALLGACNAQDTPGSPPPSGAANTVRVTVTPHEETLSAGAARDFTADVTGTASTSVLWTADGGTISASGHFVAPRSGGTFHVTATSAADAAASDTATVTVLPPGTIDPGTPGGDVTMSVDTAQSRPISRFIYGVNFLEHPAIWGSGPLPGFTLSRFGGNRLTAYDWETSYSNCGNDCGASFPNDRYLSSSTAFGAATKARADHAFAADAAFMATIPVLGWVAADASGSVTIPVAPSQTTPATPDPARFRPSPASNPSGATATPSAGDGASYQDDFVAWLDATYPGAKTDARKPIFFSLDNEPDLWGSTHAELRGKTAAGAAVYTGFDELPEKSIPYALAVKSVLPNAKVFGPALSGWFGFMTLGQPLANLPRQYAWYIDKYLESMAAAETTHGKRLLDVLDVHWYPEARNVCGPSDPPACGGGVTTNCCYADRITNDWQPQWPSVIEARVQSTRSLWDPTYVERSWVAQAPPGCSGAACAVKLLPRLDSSIAAKYPGTKLAITEYYFGRGGDISGGIAQADALGIFGRDGVYAATLWPASNIYAYNVPAGACGSAAACAARAYACVYAAFRAFLDYDGAGSGFGDLAVKAATSDAVKTSVYASVRSAGSDEVVVVAINKAMAAVSAGIAVKHATLLKTAQVYRITASGDPTQPGCTGPAREADVGVSAQNAFQTTLPPMSVSVLVLRP